MKKGPQPAAITRKEEGEWAREGEKGQGEQAKGRRTSGMGPKRRFDGGVDGLCAKQRDEGGVGEEPG